MIVIWNVYRSKILYSFLLPSTSQSFNFFDLFFKNRQWGKLHIYKDGPQRLGSPLLSLIYNLSLQQHYNPHKPTVKL